MNCFIKVILIVIVQEIPKENEASKCDGKNNNSAFFSSFVSVDPVLVLNFFDSPPFLA